MKKQNNDSIFLFVWQLAAHISIIPMIMFASGYHYAIALLVYVITGLIGVTVTYHRLLSHRSFVAPMWFEYFGTLCATWGIVGSSLGWCSNHLQHHRYSDKPNDPHSPHQMPWWKVQWFSMFSEQLMIAPSLARSKFHMFVHKHYFRILFGIVLVLALIDPFAIVYALLFPSMVLWNAGSLINNVTHLVGYRPYETSDKSTNNIILGYLVFGEGWHNHHHKYPRSYRFGEKWWEFDPGFYIIKLVKKDDENKVLRPH